VNLCNKDKREPCSWLVIVFVDRRTTVFQNPLIPVAKCNSACASSVAGTFQHGDCGAAAEDVLLRPAGAGDADAADDHDAVDERNPAA
jgi:hypothetical protein